MKLIIDIDEDRYEDTKRIASVQMNYRAPTIEQIVANGTPLPKGHDYIDRNNAITSICQWFTTMERNRQFSLTTNLAKQIAADILCEVPTIIEADKAESEDKE